MDLYPLFILIALVLKSPSYSPLLFSQGKKKRKEKTPIVFLYIAFFEICVKYWNTELRFLTPIIWSEPINLPLRAAASGYYNIISVDSS